MKRTIIPAILFTILFTASSFAQIKTFDKDVLSAKGRQAYETLLNANLFAIGGVGYSGETSKGEEAFDVLTGEALATPAFQSLISAATMEGALYALIALKMGDCPCYQEMYNEFEATRVNGEKVEMFRTASGCMYLELESRDEKKQFWKYQESRDYLGQLATSKKKQHANKTHKPN